MFDVFVRTYQSWREPQQTAKELSRLNESQLRDIGLSRHDIEKVAGGVQTQR